MDKSKTIDTISKRAIESLTRKLGSIFIDALYDKETVDIMLNADGRVWQQKFDGSTKVVDHISKHKAQAIVEMIASYHGLTITESQPRLECEFPLDNSRFAAQIPPTVSAPTWSIRKKASKIFPLESYVERGTLSKERYAKIVQAIAEYKNILIVGGTNSGKTTLANAVINEMVNFEHNKRLIVIEDTGELQCAAENKVQYSTTPNLGMDELVKTALRMNAGRIIVGEVRGKEALDLLDGWNTGHPGGVATIHATTAYRGLSRMRSMVSRNIFKPDNIEEIIGETVDLIVFINEHKDGIRKVESVLEVFDFIDGVYHTKEY